MDNILTYNTIPGVGKSMWLRADTKTEDVFSLHKVFNSGRYSFYKGDGPFRRSLTRDDVLEIAKAIMEFVGDGE